MISSETKIPPGWSRWLKRLANTGFAFLAAGGSVVAILQYFNPPTPPPVPTPYPATALPITSTPWPDPTATATATPTLLPPTVIYESPAPVAVSPTDFVLSYWQNVSDGRYQDAWAQLSPRFRQTLHNNDYTDYVRGYQQMNLCSIVVSEVRLIRQDANSAVVTAHLIYYAGAQCNASEYDFEMWLVQESASYDWLFDNNFLK